MHQIHGFDRSEVGPGPGPGWDRAGVALRTVALVFVFVLLAALLGILTRPVGFLATLWPANALLLGLFLRFPRLATPLGWLAATVGFVAADLLTGGGFVITLELTASNLIGVYVAVRLYRLLHPDDAHLRRPISVLYLFGVSVVASAAAAVVGLLAAPEFLTNDVVADFCFWFASELSSYLVFLPVMLTLPMPRRPYLRRAQTHTAGACASAPSTMLLIAVAIAFSVLMEMVVGGPGALVFPVPALIWCALTYRVFPTTVMMLGVAIGTMSIIAGGLLDSGIDGSNTNQLLSARLGIALMALGPPTISILQTNQQRLLSQLQHAATHDALTGIPHRRAFIEHAPAVVAREQGQSRPVALLMLDIDHFKTVNDAYGHLVGDLVLVSVTRAISATLRDGDGVYRLGGEEFAVLLPNTDRLSLDVVCERIRLAVETLRITIPDGRQVMVTISIGAAHTRTATEPTTVSNLVRIADDALYRAKALGRNRAFVAGDEVSAEGATRSQP